MEESPEERLASLLGASLEGLIAEKTGAFGGLLSREAAMRLICQENGISTERKLLLSEAHSSVLPFSFYARVDRVFPVQQFPGGSMRTVRIHVSDSSGEATIVLWNEQAKMAEGGFFSGSIIECSGAYVRAGEISIGRNGAISRKGEWQAAPIAGLKDGICSVEGVAEKIEGARTYRDRRTGEEKAMHVFSIRDNAGCARVVAWSMPEGARLPRQGEKVVLENAVFRNGELHLNAVSRILPSGGEAGGQRGAFHGATIDGGEAAIAIGAESFRMPVGDALMLFKVRTVPPGVGAATILSIKSRALAGMDARYFSNEGKLASLEFEG